MESDPTLRERLAREAARLLLRRKESSIAAARKRAARWLKRKGLRREDVPSTAEIQVELYALAGVFAAERDPAVLQRRREFAVQLLELFSEWAPEVTDGPTQDLDGVLRPLRIELFRCEMSQVRQRLIAAGFSPELRRGSASDQHALDATMPFERSRSPDSASIDCLELLTPFWTIISGAAITDPSRATPSDTARTSAPDSANMAASAPRFSQESTADTQSKGGPDTTPGSATVKGIANGATTGPLGSATGRPPAMPVPVSWSPASDDHEDAFEVFRLLLLPLSRVMLDPASHPEGDALYHSLQVFEQGRAVQPYDEEFLLACLLHEVGWAIDPVDPLRSGLEALGTLITDRTRFLIEQRPAAVQYLQTGRCSRSVRQSPDFDDLLLLVRCDRAGRRFGVPTADVDEALDYIAGLDTLWDEERRDEVRPSAIE
jgi:hypothetical protein